MSMTMIEAINCVVETVREFPMSGTTRPSQQTPADTTSIYARAEDFISRENMQVQSQGWPENTEPCRRFTPVSNRIALPSNILRIRASGPDAHRTLVMREEVIGGVGVRSVYDANLRTFAMGTSDVFIDAVVLLDFEDLPRPLQGVIVQAAMMKFQRRHENSQLSDQQLLMEYMQAEAIADRNRVKDDAMSFNLRPMVPQSQQPQQGQ